MKPDPALFELKHVSHRFGDFPALTDISLRIGAGERVALVGPSGAGKTTLLRLLNAALLPDEGEVWVLGRNLASLTATELRRVQRRIGFVYQQHHLVGNLRVIHNINAGRLGEWSLAKSAVSLIWPREVAQAAAALNQVGIPEKLYDRTDQLSVGQQQRVAIARVLVQQPDAILADEPIASLDPERSRETMDLLRDISQISGRTLVTSLHQVNYSSSHFQRIIGLRQGRIFLDVASDALTAPLIEALYKIA